MELREFAGKSLSLESNSSVDLSTVENVVE